MDFISVSCNSFDAKGNAKNNKMQAVNFGDNKQTEITSQTPKLYSKTSQPQNLQTINSQTDKFEHSDKNKKTKTSKIILYSTLVATLAVGVASFIKGKPADDVEKGFFKRMKDGFLDVTGIDKAKKFFAIKKFNSSYSSQTKKIDNELKSIEDLTENSYSLGIKLTDLGEKNNGKGIDLYISELAQKGICAEKDGGGVKWNDGNFDYTYLFNNGSDTLIKKNQNTEIVLNFNRKNKFEQMDVKKFNSDGKIVEYSNVDLSSSDKMKIFEKYNSNGDLMFQREHVLCDINGYESDVRLEYSQNGEILNSYQYLANDKKEHFTSMLNMDKSNSYTEKIQNLDNKTIEERTFAEVIFRANLMPRVDKYGQIRCDIKSDDKFVKFGSNNSHTYVYPSIKFKTNSEFYVDGKKMNLPEGINDKEGKLIVKTSDANNVSDIKFKDFETNKWYEIKDDKIQELENYKDDYGFVDNYYLKYNLLDDMTAKITDEFTSNLSDEELEELANLLNMNK